MASEIKYYEVRKDKDGSLNACAFDLVKQAREDGMSLPQIGEQCGVPYFWLRQYADGAIPKPGVDRIQRLYEGLSGKKIL